MVSTLLFLIYSAILCYGYLDPLPAEVLMDIQWLDKIDENALCADSSPAAYYWRNCTANVDRKPGDPDFCLKGGTQGVNSYDWVIYFASTGAMETRNEEISVNNEEVGSGAGWCYDEKSCASRYKNTPELMSSINFNTTLYPGGLLNVVPEANPNFYKQISAVIPYCSSDIWIGDSLPNQHNNLTQNNRSHNNRSQVVFRGRRIIAAAMQDMIESKGLDTMADRVFIVGGPGIMSSIDYILSLIPTSVSTVKVLCDGCVLLDMQSFSGQLAPVLTLPQAVPYWNAQRSFSHQCPYASSKSENWRCLLWSSLISSIPTSLMPIAAHHPAFDSVQLNMLGAWPVTPNSSQHLIHYVNNFARVVSKSLSQKTVPWSFSAGCSNPLSGFVNNNYFFFTKVDEYYSLAYLCGDYLNNPTTPVQKIDTCPSKTHLVDCNPTCKMPPLPTV